MIISSYIYSRFTFLVTVNLVRFDHIIAVLLVLKFGT